jgi:hypothetical protein
MPKESLRLGGGQLLIIDQRNTTAVWDERGGQWQSLELGENARVDAAIPLRDDKILLSLFSGRLVIVGPDLSWHEIPVPATPDWAYPRNDIVRLDDGRLLVARWPQGTQLWSADGTQGQRILEHTVSGAILLQDGALLVWPAAADRNALQIVGADGEPGVVLRGHEAEVRQALQLDDGRILSWAKDASVRAWPGSVEQAVAWADDVIARLRPLTHAERCEHYLETPDACAEAVQQ